jgi:hypothetical protein
VAALRKAHRQPLDVELHRCPIATRQPLSEPPGRAYSKQSGRPRTARTPHRSATQGPATSPDPPRRHQARPTTRPGAQSTRAAHVRITPLQQAPKSGGLSRQHEFTQQQPAPPRFRSLTPTKIHVARPDTRPRKPVSELAGGPPLDLACRSQHTRTGRVNSGSVAPGPIHVA